MDSTNALSSDFNETMNLRWGIRTLLTVIFGLLAPWTAARAVEVSVIPASASNPAVIQVSGEFLSGDQKKFVDVAVNVPDAIVVFDSPGGDLLAGLEIGKAIRLKEYATGVDDGMVCASACALAWLGGVKRLMSPGAHIGFHAAFNVDDRQVTGAGNAFVGAYLSQLGLTPSFIAYATERSPDESLNWLTAEQAKSMGLEVVVLNNDSGNEPAPASLPTPVTTAAVPASPSPGDADGLKRLAGYDIFGFDLPDMPIRNISADNCAAACSGNAACMAYTFNRPNGACFLKASGSTVVANANAETGYRASIEGQLHQSSMTVLEKTDLPGADYLKFSHTEFVNCLNACEGDGRCAAFTYAGKYHTCWLKSSLPMPIKMRIATSGVKRRTN